MARISLEKISDNQVKSSRGLGVSIAPVLLVSSNDKILKLGMQSLGFCYRVVAIKNIWTIKKALLDIPFRAIVLDDTVSQSDILKILHEFGKNSYNNNLPILGLSLAINSDLAAFLSDRDNSAIISGPFSQSKLIGGLSFLLNKEVIMRWNKIDTVNRAALEGCFNLFNSFPDIIAKGDGVKFENIKKKIDPIIESIQLGVSHELLDSLKGFDEYTFSHCFKTAVLLSQFGNNMGIKGDDLKILAVGGIVHDLGKLEIPYDILNKTGKLDAKEWIVMKSHVSKTSQILRTQTDVPISILTIAEEHHEKLDGSGYPYELKGIQINDLARIAAIIDIFSALTDERPYKDAISIEKTFKIMRSMADHIDQHFLSLFIESTLDNMPAEMH